MGYIGHGGHDELRAHLPNAPGRCGLIYLMDQIRRITQKAEVSISGQLKIRATRALERGSRLHEYQS